jgi:hypothetical protein
MDAIVAATAVSTRRAARDTGGGPEGTTNTGEDRLHQRPRSVSSGCAAAALRCALAASPGSYSFVARTCGRENTMAQECAAASSRRRVLPIRREHNLTRYAGPRLRSLSRSALEWRSTRSTVGARACSGAVVVRPSGARGGAVRQLLSMRTNCKKFTEAAVISPPNRGARVCAPPTSPVSVALAISPFPSVQ